MPFDYLLYDVFTQHAFSGNQLAVFPDGREIAAETMQKIARELNLSETTFVLPAERHDTDVRMRIFTPAVELPMAGHPTVGSTFALARAGVIAPGRSRFAFGLDVGPTPVDLEWKDGALQFVWMTQATPAFGRTVDARPVAEALGLTFEDIRSEVPVQEVSCGVPYLIVPLRTTEAVRRAVPDSSSLRRLGDVIGTALPLYLFAADEAPPKFLCRMFAPGFGVLEDPATGSAAGPLGCYLVQHQLVGAYEAGRLTLVQGLSMNRPSLMHVMVAGRPAAISDVKVGGTAVFVGQGELHL